MPIPEKYLARFEGGRIYHIFNRTVGGELLFREDDNYRYFLDLYQKKLNEVTATFCYSLQPNHFHFMIRALENKALPDEHSIISNQFRKLFIAYSNAYNKRYSRTGTLFQTPFKRILVTDDSYFTQVVYYIHHNHIHHGTGKKINEFKWSSYQKILDGDDAFLLTGELINWFGSKDQFIKHHDMHKTSFDEFTYAIE